MEPALLTALLGVASLLGSRWLYGDYATPNGIYGLVWSLLIGLYALRLVSYDAVAPEVWWAIFLSAVGFLGGGWTVLLWAYKGLNYRDQGGCFDQDKLARCLLLLLPLGVLGFVLQVIHLQTTMGLGVFLQDPVLARKMHTNVKYWGYFNILNVALVAMVTIYWVRRGAARPWMWLIVAVALTSALITTDRTRFFYLVLWAFYAGLYTTGGLRLTLRRGMASTLVMVVLLCFFVMVGNFYERRYADRYPEHLHFAKGAEFLVEPYIYLTGSIPALDALMKDTNPQFGGKFSFSPVVSVMNLVDSNIKPVPLQGKLYFVPMELNTYSYLQQFYLDWGWWGIFLGPYACGFLANGLYVVMRRRRTFFTIYLAALAAFCTTISIFVNMFTQEATWFFVVVGALVAAISGSGRPHTGSIPAPTTDV